MGEEIGCPEKGERASPYKPEKRYSIVETLIVLLTMGFVRIFCGLAQ